MAGAGLLVVSIGHMIWRHARARDIAERWLAQHRYRVRSLRLSYWDAPMRFRVTPFRNNDWAVDFRAEVDDMRLGGTGKVRLRVWTDWLGMIDREPEVSWDRMPTEEDGGPQSAETHGPSRSLRCFDASPTASRRSALTVASRQRASHSIARWSTCSRYTDVGC